MRGPNQVTSKSDVVAFINTASRRLTDRPAPVSGRVMCKCRPRLMLSSPALPTGAPFPAGISRSVIFHKPSPTDRCPLTSQAGPRPRGRRLARKFVVHMRQLVGWSIIFTRLLSRPTPRRQLGRAGKLRTAVHRGTAGLRSSYW